MIVLLNLFLCLFLCGCDIEARLLPMKKATSTSPVTFSKSLAATGGGSFRHENNAGFKSDVSFGSPVNFVQRETPSGYRVQLQMIGSSAPE